jgi:hypothetical protein
MVDLERADLYEWKSADAAKLTTTQFTPDRVAFRQALENRASQPIEDVLEASLRPARAGHFLRAGFRDRLLSATIGAQQPEVI